MVLNRKELTEAITRALEDKGKRKFTQSVEIIVNLKGIDFTKPENRLNLDVVLPRGKGKKCEIAVFADGQLAVDAKAAGAERIIAGSEIATMAADKAKLKNFVSKYEFLAQPQLMMQIGKSLGQVLGTRGKLPKPAAGDVKGLIERTRKTVKIKSKGKYLPNSMCLFGNETMTVEDLADNAEAVYDAIKNKIGGDQNIRSVLVKLSMGKPQKVQANG
ncbi:50S ribosomal protein L1 [Candidatus Gugararchaeum adminiculabundum]|nr:50S ribosomal protein L1 [Candidatus Gugararchaeum adminiculabundum]